MKLSSVIKSRLALYEIAPVEMAAACRWSMATYYNRMKEPDKITLGELKIIAKKTHTTINSLLEEVK